MSIHRINLAQTTNGGYTPGRPIWVIGLWMLFEFLLLTNPLQISSRVRAWLLRVFGARIGEQVILRPRLRIKYPWRLSVGDRSWLGEGVWIHNQAEVAIGSDTAISQETFITTGSHAFTTNMDLLVCPVRIGDGVWIASRCLILQGAFVGDDTVVAAGSVVTGSLPGNSVCAGTPARRIGSRFSADGKGNQSRTQR